MRDLLKQCLPGSDQFVELRHHSKSFRSITISQGRLESSVVRRRDGVGVRTLVDGTWGFAATSDLSVKGVKQAIADARSGAQASASLRKNRIGALPAVSLAVGEFSSPGIDDVLNRSLDEKIATAVKMEEAARTSSERIRSAVCRYDEIHEAKSVVTTDGADVTFSLVRPQFRVSATAEHNGERISAGESVGVTGGWDCLFRQQPDHYAEKAARMAVDLLSARQASGGRTTVIMSPSIVGLLVHEAVGHTVEADFVMSGSAAAGKIGKRVASDLVTLCDSGRSEYHPGAGGSIFVDDEGVLAERTEIIKNGIMNSYLHNRESAAHFGVAPTGNARAWEYADKPLIRMRNTYLEPGTSSLEEMIASTEDGYLLDGPRNGQADATAEFMFGVVSARRIKNGKLGELVRGVTVTGNAFEVLQTVDAVSKEFVWDLGSGHCGKGQPAKVDAGGPYIRCKVVLGGQQ